jgi:hypothetical protein
MIQKTNAAYLQLQTYSSSWTRSPSFVSNDPADCCCCAPSLDASSFENGYSRSTELVRSAVSEGRVCKGCVTCISHTVLHGTIQPSIRLCQIQEFRAKRAHLQRQRVLVDSLCLMQLWTLFGLACTAAHKNQRAERVVPKILSMRLLMKPYKLQLVQAQKTSFGRTLRILPRLPSQD